MTDFGEKNIPVPNLPLSIGIIVLVALISGCSRYSVSINDNMVYSPPAVFTDFSLPDSNLRNCIDDTIADEHLTGPEQLTRLFCTNRAIQSLEGLEIFDRLQFLGLQDNLLTSVMELTTLPKLRQVNLAGNSIADAAPLGQLKTLEYVDFTNNPTLNCLSLKPLQANDVDVKLPEHCR